MQVNILSNFIYLVDNNIIRYNVLIELKVIRTASNVNLTELDLIKEKYCLVFSIDSLNHLQKGGRISSTKAVLGNILNVKPICEVKDGLVSQLGQVRGKKKVISKLIETTDELTNGQIDNKVMYVGYMDNIKERDALIEALKQKYNPEKIGSFRIGSCIGSHSGPGVLGILSFKK